MSAHVGACWRTLGATKQSCLNQTAWVGRHLNPERGESGRSSDIRRVVQRRQIVVFSPKSGSYLFLAFPILTWAKLSTDSSPAFHIVVQNPTCCRSTHSPSWRFPSASSSPQDRNTGVAHAPAEPRNSHISPSVRLPLCGQDRTAPRNGGRLER